MARDPFVAVVDGVPGGTAALRAMAEAVGALVEWPVIDDEDEDRRMFASMVLHDSGAIVRRGRRAVPLSATVLVWLVLVYAAEEAGVDRRQLWRRVARRIDKLMEVEDD